MTKQQTEELSDAIRYCFSSQHALDANLEPAGVVDVLANLTNAAWGVAEGLLQIADAIAARNHQEPTDATPAND